VFFPEGSIRVFVYGKPTDMRKSFTGLYSLTKNVLKEDPLSGSLFVFINRRGNYLKILYWDRTGFCLWSKKIEQGCFAHADNETHKRELNWIELKLLLEGIELKNIHQRKRFKLENK